MDCPASPTPPSSQIHTAMPSNLCGTCRHWVLHTSFGGLLLQASNVATYIAHGDVALSVLMTTASTLGAIIMTPLLTKTLAGTLVPVDAKVSASCCMLTSAKVPTPALV